MHGAYTLCQSHTNSALHPPRQLRPLQLIPSRCRPTHLHVLHALAFLKIYVPMRHSRPFPLVGNIVNRTIAAALMLCTTRRVQMKHTTEDL